MKNKKGNVAVIALIIVIVAIIAGVVGWMFAMKSSTQQKEITQPAQTIKTQSAVQQKVKKNVSVNGSNINVDTETFVTINKEYVKDNNSVYYCYSGSPCYLIHEADSLTFQSFGSSYYAKDKNNAYYRGGVIDGADSKTFESPVENGYYAKDKNSAYYTVSGQLGGSVDAKLSNVDLQTFQIIGRTFAKDKLNVYNGGEIISGANPASFKVLSDYFSKDDKHSYYFNTIIAKADPETFSAYFGENEDYARDNVHVFFHSYLIPNADSATFYPDKDVMDPAKAKDKKSLYECSANPSGIGCDIINIKTNRKEHVKF